MPTYNDRVFNLVRQYRYNHHLFSEQQVDELQELANQYNVPFNRKTEEFKLRNVAQQLTSGFLEGFTTIPVNKLGAQAPKTVYESIAHSLGHLAGFAPGIVAAPLSLGARGMAKLAPTVSKKLAEGAVFTSKASHWSVPMMVGDKAKKIVDSGLRKSKLEALDFMKKGAKTRAVLDQAVHLGAASAMSAIWKGPDVMMDAGVSGAVAGGAFGGLGEIRAIGNYLKSKNVRDFRKGEQRLKSAVGAAMLGLPTAMQGEPIEMIMYQTLLGGYFGYGARPTMEAEGGKFIRRLRFTKDAKYIFTPGEHPDFNDYSKGAQEYIRKQSTEQSKTWLENGYYGPYGWKPDEVRFEVEDTIRKKNNIPDSEPITQEQIDKGYMDLANEKYTATRNAVIEKYEIIDKEFGNKINNIQPLDKNDTVELEKNKTKKSEATDKRAKDQKVFVVVDKIDEKGNHTIEILGGLDEMNIGFNGSYNKFNIGEKYENKPADVIEGEEYLLFNGVFIKEPAYKSENVGTRDNPRWIKTIDKDDKGNIKYKVEKYKPIEFKTTNRDPNDPYDPFQRSENIVDKATMWGMEVSLDKSGRYLFGGVKDKGIYTIRKYHKDINKHTIEELTNALVSEKIPVEEARAVYKASLNEWAQRYPDAYKNRPDDLKQMHDKAWMSNILVTAQRHGLLTPDLSKIHNILKPGFAKNVIDWNKREQLWQDRSSPLPKGTLGGKIPFIIIDDVLGGRYELDTGEFKNHDSDHDGTIYFYRNDKSGINDIKTMQEALGLPGNVNMNKPVIVAEIPGHGTMVLKAAGAGSPPEIQKFMDKTGVKMVIMRSAAKHTGGIKTYQFNRDLLEKGQYELTEPFDGREYNTISDADIRINTGTYENPRKFGKGSKIVRQLATNLSSVLSPKTMDILWNDVYLKSIEGVPEVNDKIDKILKGEKIDFKEIDPNDISVEKLHDIFVNHGETKLAKKLAKDIVKMDTSGELEDIETFSESEYKEYIYKNNRILINSDLSQSQREMGLYAREFFENNYKKYLLNRYVSPTYKQSAKVWLAPRHPHDVVQDNVKFGEFKIGDGGKKMKVIYEGKETTLGKAWDKAKKNNKSDDFDFLVVRVPADSISGTRALKFAGFTGEKGISITTNAKDNMYLGGADKDSDTAFIYQDMPKEVVESIRDKTNEWETEGKWIDSKKEDRLFESITDDNYKSPFSQFSPSFRRTVSETAARGQAAIGYGVVGKTNLLDYADYLHKHKGGVDVVPLIDKNGKKYGYIKVKLKPGKETHEILSRLGREILNRSADAADYSSMMDFARFRDLLVEQAFDTEYVNNYSKYKGVAPYRVLANKTRLKEISEVTRLSKYRTSDNLDSLFRSIERLDSNILDTLGGLTGKALRKMKQDNLDTSFITKDTMKKYIEQVELFKNQINEMEKDPLIKTINQMQYGVTMKRLIQVTNVNRALKQGRWTDARWQMERDLKVISSWNALNKKGFNIHKNLKDMDIFANVDAMVNKILKPIAEEATSIKQRQDNRWIEDVENSDLNHKIEFDYDTEVRNYKNYLTAKAKQYSKKFGDKNLITEKMLHDYFEQWLLSPFYHNQTKKVITKRGYEIEVPITRHTKHAYQSQRVSDSSIKYLLKEQDAIFEEIRIAPKDVDVKKVLDPEAHLSNAIEPDPDVIKYRERIYKDDTHFLRSRALTDKEYREVLDFENTLKDNKFIEDNLADFYENFTVEALNKPRKDLDLISIEDIMAMNRYLKDMDMRTKPFGSKLPDFAWRASPEYMDLYMRNFEEKFFISSQEYVKTRDGLVMREVKKYTSTLGEIKHFLNKVVSKMESRAGLVSPNNDILYPHRNLPKAESELINDFMVDAIQGVEYKTRKDYLDLQNKIFKNYYKGKDYTLDQIIQDGQARYKADFERFSLRFIHSRNNKGEFMTGLKDEKGRWKEKNLWDQIDNKKKYGTYNNLLKWKADGKFDMENFNKKVFNEVGKGNDIPEMQLETIYRAIYEMHVESYVNQMSKYSKLSKQQLRENFRQGKTLDSKVNIKELKKKDAENLIKAKGFKFTNVGRKNLDSYFPHTNFGRNAKTRLEVKQFVDARVEEIRKTEGNKAAELYKLRRDLFVDKSKSTDAGGAASSIESVMVDFNKVRISDLERLGLNTRPQSVHRREGDMPGYDRTEYAIDHYKESMINALYKNIASLQASQTINKFVKTKPFGNKTNDWALYLRTYVRDSLGLPTVFGDRILEYMNADKKFKRRGVYLFSDENVIRGFEAVNKQFKKLGRELPGMKDIPNVPNEKLLSSKDPMDVSLYWAQYNARMQALTRMIHNIGRYEAKFQLWTLLGHTKIMAGNLFGGTANTITRGGLKNFRRANDKKFIEKNIIRDPNGNLILKFENGKYVQNAKEFNDWISEKGIIESFIANELNLNIALKDVKGNVKQNMIDFSKELGRKLKFDPEMKEDTVLDIARKYRVDKLIDTSAAWFMQTSERKLRRDAFLTHSIEYMEHFGKDGYKLTINDPAVFEAGIRGVEATQYLYHSAFRPGYMRTALGKTLSRFKLFVFNSVRIRKEMLRKAKYYGYKEGTKEFDKFKTDFAINMFVMALGTAFAFSLFDTSLPPPYDWVQETGDWLLGDKKTRDRAFFGQYPYPIAPLNIITPPVANIPMAFFSNLINKDWERFFDYHVYLMFPFGRMLRSIDKTIDEPYGTFEGRAMQQFFGIPLDKVRSKIDKAQLTKARKEKIDSELKELYG